MSNKDIKSSKKTPKKMFSLLGQKTESSFSLNKRNDHLKSHNKCQICKRKTNLFQCTKCSIYYCSKCIKQIKPYKTNRIKRNEFICENCNESQILCDEKQNNYQKYFCFICSTFLDEKNKSTFLMTKKQELELKNELIKRCLLLGEKDNDSGINENAFSLIRLCKKCQMTYYELIENILNKNFQYIEYKKKKYNDNKKAYDLYDNLINSNLFNNFNNNKNFNDFKKDNVQEIKNIVNEKNNNFTINVNNKEINCKNNIKNENDNKFNIQQRFENNNLYKDINNIPFINNNINNNNKYSNQNEFINNDLNLFQNNNNNFNFLNSSLNKPMISNINNNFSNLYDFFNFDNKNNTFNNINVLNDCSNFINNLNNLNNNLSNNQALINNLSLNNGNQFYNSNYLPNLNQNNNLGNNIYNVNKNNNLNNKNISDINNKNKLNDLNENDKEKKSNVKYINNENYNKDESSFDSENIYYCLYKMKEALCQITNYLTVFENNNVDCNNSLLENMEFLTIIFSSIIRKMKNEKKINYSKYNINNNNNNNNNNEDNEFKIEINNDNLKNDNRNQDNNKENNNENIININNDTSKNENEKTKDKIDENNNNNNEKRKKFKIKGNKKKELLEEEENEEFYEESYDYYLDYILSVNDSFKIKLKAMKIFNDLKNTFFIILFKNIENLISKFVDYTTEEQNKYKTQSQKNEIPKEPHNLNEINKNLFQYDISKINMNNFNNIPHKNNNIFNQTLPPLTNLPNFNYNPQQYIRRMPLIMQNNNINKDFPIINNNELNYSGNIPNIFNINSKLPINNELKGFGINPLPFQSNKNKNNIDNNSYQNIKK